MAIQTNNNSASSASYAVAEPAEQVQGSKQLPLSFQDGVLEQASIDWLPADISGLIFNYATNGGKDGKSVSSIRAVSPYWLSVCDNKVLRFCWLRVHPDLRAFAKEFSALSNPTPERKYFSRFSDLTQGLKRQEVPVRNEACVLGFEPKVYEERMLDRALEILWAKIQNQINFEGAPIPANAAEIRLWLNDPANRGKIDRIAALSFSDANLDVLPPEIGKFTGLRRLFLNNNQLKSLPCEIGNLIQLQGLSISGNRLKCLPPEIGKLAQLQELYVSDNHLESLPPEIGNLDQLQKLVLVNNRLRSLPREIENLDQLQEIYIYENPLVFVLDNDQRNIYRPDGWRSWHKQLTSVQCAQKYENCINFECSTPFSLLCQEVYRGSDLNRQQEKLEALPYEMKQRVIHQGIAILSASGLSWDDSLDPMYVLLQCPSGIARAVVAAASEKMNSLPADKKCEVYRLVSKLAGQPEDEVWGEKHAADNTIRLIEAMELATR